jgi:4,4'-diaponeurosporenoate glycosyltransferase
MDTTSLVVLILFWSLGFLFLFRIPRCTESREKSESRPSVSIIIPARNEERTIPVLLASIRQQELVPDEVIVVVDESDESTAAAAENQGPRVLRAAPRPAGWLGKPWACLQGAQAATNDILVFLDADTCLETGGLRRLVDECVKTDGVVTVQPFHTVKRPHEQLSAFFNIIGMAGMGTFTLFGRTIKPVGLFGPCIAIRKAHYFSVGGHSSVKKEVVEDLALGTELKRKKTPICAYGGKGTISFRMYQNGPGQLIEGWSKGFATGAVKTYFPILIAIVLWIGGSISATRYPIQAAFNHDMLLLAGWGTAYLAYVAQIYWMLRRVGTFRFYAALLYPLSLLFFMVVFFYSVFLIFVRRSVRWKGVKIRLEEEGPPS